MRWTAKQQVFPDGPTWDVTCGADRFTVDVVPGPDRLLRLERAVNEALGIPARQPPEPPLWRVDVDEHHGGGLFELEITITWRVVDATTGQPRWQFQGGSSGSYDGVGWDMTGTSGCDEVVLGADGEHVLARDSDDVTCHPLPILA